MGLRETAHNFGTASTELVQLVFSFFLGLVFGSVLCTPGWLILYIIFYEVFVFWFTGSSPYYRAHFRVAMNAVFLISIVLGSWIQRRSCPLASLVYGEEIADETLLSRILSPILNSFFPIDEEEEDLEEIALKRQRLFFRSSHFGWN